MCRQRELSMQRRGGEKECVSARWSNCKEVDVARHQGARLERGQDLEELGLILRAMGAPG